MPTFAGFSLHFLPMTLLPLQQTLIDQTAEFVRRASLGEGSGHDWWHIYRVHKMAVHLAEKEQADLFTVQLAALLHDMDDWKFHKEGSVNAANHLKTLALDTQTIQAVLHMIAQVSYRGAGEDTTPDTLEARVVQDADRLDAIGAIGIARAFAYGGAKQRLLFDPALPPVMHSSFEEYKSKTSHTINHFYEKLLLLKERLHTATARQIAGKRHAFMEQFLENFYEEWFLFEENSYLKKQ